MLIKNYCFTYKVCFLFIYNHCLSVLQYGPKNCQMLIVYCLKPIFCLSTWGKPEKHYENLYDNFISIKSLKGEQVE